MAKATIEVVEALRRAARVLAQSDRYEWGHMGGCNCGHLAQAVTGSNRAAIHQAAMQRYGDWATQLRDYCPQSGLPLDVIIDQMLHIGFSREDLANLEKLSDKQVLQRLPQEKRYPKHNAREDVVLYLQTWADIVEEQLLRAMQQYEPMQEQEQPLLK